MLQVYSSEETGQGARISASVERPQSSLWLGDAATSCGHSDPMSWKRLLGPEIVVLRQWGHQGNIGSSESCMIQ